MCHVLPSMIPHLDLWQDGRVARKTNGSPGKARQVLLILVTIVVGVLGYNQMQNQDETTPAPGSTTAKPSASSSPDAAPGLPRPTSDFPEVDLTYEPKMDGDADPGEVVWTWVAYEDDPSQGKDRPVLVFARSGDDVLGLMMTTRDRAASGSITEENGRYWYDLGSGPWDSKGRPSEIRLDRVLVLDPQEIRREGAILERSRFDKVIDAVKTVNNW